MSDSKTKYEELVESGEINPNEPIRKLTLMTLPEIRQVAFDAGLWVINTQKNIAIGKNKNSIESLFDKNFDNWFANRINLNK